MVPGVLSSTPFYRTLVSKEKKKHEYADIVRDQLNNGICVQEFRWLYYKTAGLLQKA
jgi:hypothetical protein